MNLFVVSVHALLFRQPIDWRAGLCLILSVSPDANGKSETEERETQCAVDQMKEFFILKNSQILIKGLLCQALS